MSSRGGKCLRLYRVEIDILGGGTTRRLMVGSDEVEVRKKVEEEFRDVGYLHDIEEVELEGYVIRIEKE